MQVETKKSIAVTLILTQEETEWLHETMQNPINYDNPERESTRDAQMRMAFFKATNPI